jgi:hypothetical protein
MDSGVWYRPMTEEAPTPVSLLNDLLEVDEKNVQGSLALMWGAHPTLPRCFDEANALFGAFGEALEGSEFDVPAAQRLSEIAHDLRVSNDELARRLHRRELAAPEEGPGLWLLLLSRQVAKIVCSFCWRSFRWGATDLRRFRVTAALGYLRQEAEAVALTYLFSHSTEIAERWAYIRSTEDGRVFFRETQPRIKAILTDLGLSRAYEIGSSASVHVRLAGIAMGAWNLPGYTGVKDQDFDQDDPYSYLNAVVYFLEIQAQVLRGVARAFPDLDATGWHEGIGPYAGRVRSVRASLTEQFPDEAAAVAREMAP